MKEWMVKIVYEYEGSPPFDLHSCAQYIVKAKSKISALKEAQKLLKKEIKIQGVLSYKCKEIPK